MEEQELITKVFVIVFILIFGYISYLNNFKNKKK